MKLFRNLIISKKFPNNIITQDKYFWDIFIRLYKEGKAVTSLRELHNIYRLVKQTSKIDGDVAEVGVYKGGSAKMIAELKGDKKLHLFDTFEGMPEVNSSIDLHKKGDYKDTSLDSVKNYLSNYKNICFYKGYFPASLAGSNCHALNFSFANLDVDLYESTKSCLEFFYGRLNKGGVILSHDYRSISCPGVRRAFDEFFLDKPEIIIELWDSQCLIVKM
jgi:hypothetical protein